MIYFEEWDKFSEDPDSLTEEERNRKFNLIERGFLTVIGSSLIWVAKKIRRAKNFSDLIFLTKVLEKKGKKIEETLNKKGELTEGEAISLLAENDYKLFKIEEE